MSPTYPIDELPATPEYVLELLRLFVGEGDFDLDETCSLGLFFGLIDDMTWGTTQKLRARIDTALQFNIPASEWREALPRLYGRTVGDLCRFLASRITRPSIRPWPHVSGPCLPAGAFLTVRHLLEQDGQGVEGILPSTPLAPYVDRLEAQPVFATLARLDPLRIPKIKRHYRRWWLWVPAYLCVAPAAIVLALIGAIIALVGASSPRLIEFIVGISMFAAAIPLAISYRWLTASTGAEIQGMSTFRDLAYHLAGERRSHRRAG